ncbi:hypothetical protein V1224_07635 [Lachnospiraceae bacterium JLR.KK008]
MKRIEVCKMRVGDLKHNFGNPRKISKKKAEELERSMDLFGDFGVFVVDEHNNVIAGNQRSIILARRDPDIEVDVKKLIGYSEAELRSINIMDNTHAGEWDLELLADWTADLNLDLGIDLNNENPEERKIEDMELIRYEKYNYVMIVCKSEIDYNDLIRKLGIEGRKVAITKKRKIKARAIWYDQMKAQIVEKPPEANQPSEDDEKDGENGKEEQE